MHISLHRNRGCDRPTRGSDGSCGGRRCARWLARRGAVETAKAPAACAALAGAVSGAVFELALGAGAPGSGDWRFARCGVSWLVVGEMV